MKKLFVITCAAALMSIGSTAQVQDADTASTDYNLQETEDRMEQDLERTGDEIQNETDQAGDELRRETDQAGDELEQGAERTEDEIEQGAERTGDEIDQGMERTGDELEEAGDEIDQNTQPADETPQDPSDQGLNQDPTNQDTDTRGENDTEAAPTGDANRTGARDQSFANPIEVLEDKEGPENQVVYEYQGELFYVDREEGKLVKTKKSELKDVNQNKIVDNDQQTEDQ